ncbi:hypothetical protein [Burkholderia cenocepacia]|uniref:hypothetical protein n=1 Tax=Burkholderia cenocepacia TaxID=95486 RepID=UPI000761C048|nr:hypothetical protein [Burkholderia cenocepacia]KWU19195.1 hypothetical protein AS149_13190 [Burkholderia cenocepacia]
MTTAKKTAAPKGAAKAAPTRKAPRKAKAKRFTSASGSGLYLDKDVYSACIDGLMDQGLDHKEAVETLRVGMRQANGRPVPLELLAIPAANSPSMLAAA